MTHTPDLDDIMPEGPQAYVPNEHGNYYATPEVAELARLREVNRELVAALREAQATLNGAPNTIGLHSQIDAALAKAKETP